MNARAKSWSKHWLMFSQGIDMQKVTGVSPIDLLHMKKRPKRSIHFLHKTKQTTTKRRDKVLPNPTTQKIPNTKYVQLPEHKRKNVVELYHAAKSEFHPEDVKERKRKFFEVLKLYYPYFTSMELESAYMSIKTIEESYIHQKKIVEMHGNYGERIVKLFGVIDKDKSGSISIEEFKNAFKSYGLNIENIDEQFKNADADGNGTLDVMELLAFLSSNKFIMQHFESVLKKSEDKKNRQIREDKLLFLKTIPENGERPSLVHMNSLDEQIRKIRSSKFMV